MMILKWKSSPWYLLLSDEEKCSLQGTVGLQLHNLNALVETVWGTARTPCCSSSQQGQRMKIMLFETEGRQTSCTSLGPEDAIFILNLLKQKVVIQA